MKRKRNELWNFFNLVESILAKSNMYCAKVKVFNSFNKHPSEAVNRNDLVMLREATYYSQELFLAQNLSKLDTFSDKVIAESTKKINIDNKKKSVKT